MNELHNTGLTLRRKIPKATRLLPNFDHTDYGYGTVGSVAPGDIHLIAGIGPYRPERGCVWLKDYCQAYWEVSDGDLKKGLAIQEPCIGGS